MSNFANDWYLIYVGGLAGAVEITTCQECHTLTVRETLLYTSKHPLLG
jgi:hypothetical protein